VAGGGPPCGAQAVIVLATATAKSSLFLRPVAGFLDIAGTKNEFKKSMTG
jgi:hypothetical protein